MKKGLLGIIVVTLLLFISACGKTVRLEDFMILGMSDTKTHVRSDIYLKKEYQDTDIRWETSNPEVIPLTGKVIRPEVGKKAIEVVLTAHYGDKTQSFNLTVVPKTGDEIYDQYPSLNDANSVLVSYSGEAIIQMIERLKQEKTHAIFYLGFASCPYCREYIYYFNQIAKQYGVTEIVYYDILEDRKYYEDTDKGPFKGIISYLEMYPEVVDFPKVLADQRVSLLAPTFFSVYEGKVVDFFSGSIEGHISGQARLNDAQKELLRAYLDSVIQSGLTGNCSC